MLACPSQHRRRPFRFIILSDGGTLPIRPLVIHRLISRDCSLHTRHQERLKWKTRFLSHKFVETTGEDMPRIPYLDMEQASSEYREMLKGRFDLNLYRMLPHATTIAPGFLRMGRAILRESTIDPTLREIVILRVGFLSNDRYDVYHHERAARKIGMSKEKIEAIESHPESAVFSPLEKLIIRYTDEVVKNVKAPDALFNELLAQIGNRTMAELTLTIGFYMAAGRFLENLGVEIEPER
jgi:4-carboxymuconolactone decarboxylase